MPPVLECKTRPFLLRPPDAFSSFFHPLHDSPRRLWYVLLEIRENLVKSQLILLQKRPETHAIRRMPCRRKRETPEVRGSVERANIH